MNKENLHHIVIVGGGFGGLYAAKELAKSKSVKLTVIDKRNFHLFQPLLYQVATGGLSPGDIASPIRSVFTKYKNVTVLRGKVVDILPDEKSVELNDGERIYYDSLIVASGVRYNYFGNEKWLDKAPPLKTMEDSLGIRHRIFKAFEEAEREKDKTEQQKWLRFIIVGGGPTGVELAGALGELAHFTLKNNFRNFDPRDSEIILVELVDRILPTYDEKLSANAEKSLNELGVTIKTNTTVTNLEGDTVILKDNGDQKKIAAKTILWAAGVKASGLGKVLESRTGAKVDNVGRVYVNPDFTLSDKSDLYVIGDIAVYEHQGNKPLPGVAPAAMQQGKYIASLIKSKLEGRPLPTFKYSDKGSLAVIGRNQAVAEIWKFKFGGIAAWFIWAFIHIRYLIEFDSRVLVMFQWFWSYITMKRGARLVTGDAPFPYLDKDYSSEVRKDE